MISSLRPSSGGSSPSASTISGLSDSITSLRARRLVIESDNPLIVEADGELPPLDGRRLEITLEPGALRVLS